ncbi:MAG: hypothetical protein JW757_10710 [Anaerolineales bacterium]|nr:hypothetical protein [Anaerolineales bacterium]
MNLDLVVAVIAAVGFGWCYYRLFKGTGLIIGLALELLVGLAVLNFPDAGIYAALGLGIAAFLFEVRHYRSRKKWAGSRMTFEGGGIRRGLSPVQVGILFDRPESELIQLGLVEALEAGTVSLQDGDEVRFSLAEHLQVGEELLNPLERRETRRQAARKAFQIIAPNDDVLLELIRQHEEKPVGSLPAKIWLEKTAERTEFEMTGFDVDQTITYYDAFISHRLMGVAGGHFDADDFPAWTALAGMTGILDAQSLAVVQENIRPAWLPPGQGLSEWLKRLAAAFNE